MSVLVAGAQLSAILAAHTDTGGGEATVFWVLGPVMVVASTGLLFAKKAVHAALSMALVMICLGVVYLTQQAPFLGAVQVFVYTGAVMMLFLFVLMLVGVDSADSLVETIKGQRAAAVLLGLGMAIGLVTVIGHTRFQPAAGLGDVNAAQGNITGLAGFIYGDYVWAFEVTSALLITAALGRDGARAPRAPHAPPDPARAVAAAHQGRPDQGPAAGTRRLRPAQRGEHPGTAARRHPQRALGLARADRARPDALGRVRGRRRGRGAGRAGPPSR